MVAALAHGRTSYEFAATAADLVFVTPTDEGAVKDILGQIGTADNHPKVIADIVVAFGGDDEFDSDALVFGGQAAELVDLLLDWQGLGVSGFRLRPAVNAADLPVIVDEVVPRLQRAGRFRRGYVDRQTLRERFGLPVTGNRYAPAVL